MTWNFELNSLFWRQLQHQLFMPYPYSFSVLEVALAFK
jgi:hypothetical protein